MAAGTEVVVRDIYGVHDATGWNDNQRKKFRDDQLDRRADVLFRVYSPVHPPDIQKLHCLLLRPTRDPIWWMMFIRRHYEVLTVREFPNHLQEINNNHDENNSADDHIEDLTVCLLRTEVQFGSHVTNPFWKTQTCGFSLILPKQVPSFFPLSSDEKIKEEAEMSAVRDMYEGLDVGNMTESEQRRHRNIQLNQHPDVLFRVYRRGRLHVLLFRPPVDEIIQRRELW
ncbi:hypothetical protein DPX16_0106 [Anabarilius grahami]|uniref:Uncharacterized protein n=1 Tax=Anabarilius grahami TaxID=495550 RepID=A0A3N0Z3X8_ANAGA|nr:hypothetical protein DPX16_0106 [Anabarilius grahami]